MEGVLTVTEYAEQIREYKNNPVMLANIHIECAAKYAFISEIAKDLQIEKAGFWGKKFEGEKALSDTHLEAQWRLTEGGKKEIRLKYELKALSHLMSAITGASVVNSVESRNMR